MRADEEAAAATGAGGAEGGNGGKAVEQQPQSSEDESGSGKEAAPETQPEQQSNSNEEAAQGEQPEQQGSSDETTAEAQPEQQPEELAVGDGGASDGGKRYAGEVPDAAVDIPAKANKLLGLSILRKADATPFKKCNVQSVAFEPGNDARTLGMLRELSKLGGEVITANVTNVPCRVDGGAQCCTRPFSFRFGSTDYLVFQQIFRDHFLRALYDIFPKDQPPKYILDAGGNAGFSTCLFKLLFPETTVVTLEPDASNFAMLQRNTQGFDKVHLLQAGLWGRQANITLAGAGSLGMEWGKVFREAEGNETGIPAYSVSDVAAMFEIPKFDYIKIDIEGAEGRVFEPGADISWVGQASVISLEVHDFFASKFALKAVSSRVDAAFKDTPYSLFADNEHIIYVHKELLGARVGAMEAAKKD